MFLLNKDLSDECLGMKLRVTENRRTIFDFPVLELALSGVKELIKLQFFLQVLRPVF